VEREYGHSILNSQHAVWSIGAVVGGSVSAVVAGAGVPLGWHLALAAALLCAVTLVASRRLLPGPDRQRAVQPAPGPGDGRAGSWSRGRDVWHQVGHSLVALGLVATLAQLLEDVGGAWSPVYLRSELDAAPAVAGAAFVTLQGMQTVGRLVGDRVVRRYGDPLVARVGAGAAGTAVLLALAVPSAAGTIAAFAVVGLGIATLIPAAMRAGDALPGLAPGVGLTVLGSVARVGSLVAAAGVGVVSDRLSVRAALLVLPLAAGAVVLLAPVLRVRPVPVPGPARAAGR